MARIRRRSYTIEEKIALVTGIDRRYRAGEGTLAGIARELGTAETNYYHWVRAGIRPRAQVPEKPARLAKGCSYGDAERERLLQEVDELRACGHGTEAACKAVGISQTSYRRWRKPRLTLTMRPVEVTAMVPLAPSVAPLVVPQGPPSSRTFALVAPGGYRLEGLDVGSAAVLLRALS